MIFNSIFSKTSSILMPAFLCLSVGCTKLVEVDAPTTSTNSDLVYANDASATAVLTDLYTRINTVDFSMYPGLSSDELTLFSGATDLGLRAYYENNLTVSLTGQFDFWVPLYNLIFVCNSAIEGLNGSNALTSNVKKQLLGEAKFIRAFSYFYLVNLFGDVPLNITSNYKENSTRGRTDLKLVYDQIVKDLEDADSSLQFDYINAAFQVSDSRVRPNKYAAKALLSKVFLYMSEFSKSEEKATEVINNKTLYDTVPLNNVFLKESKEIIWAIQPTGSGPFSNTGEGQLYVLPNSGPDKVTYAVYLSNHLLQSFEANDKRVTYWIGVVNVGGTSYQYPYKYKFGRVNSDSKEFSIVLRISDLYLIRAESRARQNKITEGSLDLNVIRNRAGLPATTATNQSELLDAVFHERQVEMFTELGNRWMDLKRLKKADEVLKKIKGSNWQETDQLYPIPLSEMQSNPSISGHQNSGY